MDAFECSSLCGDIFSTDRHQVSDVCDLGAKASTRRLFSGESFGEGDEDTMLAEALVEQARNPGCDNLLTLVLEFHDESRRLAF
jgi:hypothetical protein